MLGRVFQSAINPSRLMATRLAARGKSTIPQGVKYSNVHSDMKQTWLCDPGAYPIIIIISFATTMCASFSAYKFFSTPDNRVDPKKRNSLMRYWQ